MIILKFIDKVFAEISIFLIKIYQYTISPDKGLPSLRLKGKICAHTPHCSEYSIKALKRYGFLFGSPKVIERVFSCVGSKEKIYDPEYYKVVFFSGAPIAVPFLHQLKKDKRFDIVGVVTMPDAPSGRGMEIKPNIIKKEAENIFSNNDDKIQIIPYTDTYKESISTLYDKCFNNKTFGTKYNYNYCLSHIESRSKSKSFIGKILLLDGNFVGYYQAFSGNDMINYFQEAFDIETLNKIIKSYNDLEFKNIFRLDDIMIEKKSRNKGYFNELLNDLYKNLKSRNIDYLAIYTAPNKKLLKKYFKRGFKKIGELNEKNTGTEYVILIKDLNKKEPEQYFIQTPESLRLDSKKYSEEAHNFKLRLESKNPDYLVVIAYGKIIPQYILDIAKIASINVHGSLLPKYRGASPLQSIFLNREKKSGITIMKMDADMDTGNMIDMLKFDIKFNWTVNNLIDEIMKKGPKFLNKTLANYAKRLLGEVKQENDKATYCQKITKEDGEINAYTDTLENIYSKYRAYFMRPKIFFHISLNKGEKAKRVIIENLELDEKKFEEYKNSPLIEGNKLNNAIINIALKPEGKKSMDRKSFKTGYIK